ncbi:MAG: glycine oxidase ThiO [Polyangiaceae bacterium]|nr:glycine oxidase ThiO [Polyangiaceae bacterium]
MSALADVVVIGGGAIGCSAALALAKRGRGVRVLERAHPGAEASSAAAGILGAYAEAHDNGPLTQLFIKSLHLYTAWTSALTEATGIDTGYRPSGSMRVYTDEAAFQTAAAEGAALFANAAQLLDARAAREAEPLLSANVCGALLFPADCRIDPPALVRAIEGAARRAGVSFDPPGEATRILTEGDRVTGVQLASGDTVYTSHVVLCAGAWSLLPGSGLTKGEIEPIRGQMIELRTASPFAHERGRALDHVVFGPRAYLSPRDDGRIIVGSTAEHVGFRKAVTVRGIGGLLDGVRELFPSLGEAEIAKTWAGLRPATPDGGPLLGFGASRGLVVAAGHYRNGILLAPITAEIVASLVHNETPSVPLAPFAVDRFKRRDNG